jgi:hypothetical protein
MISLRRLDDRPLTAVTAWLRRQPGARITSGPVSTPA